MPWSAVRQMASCVLLILFPAAMFAADPNAAMLYTNGAAWVNGTHVPYPSSAIFSGDLLQTRTDSVAKINETGSTITVLPESLVQFDPAMLKIEHGGVDVSTSRKVGTSAGEVKVKPASLKWTEFEVVDVDGTVKIAARKGDLTVTYGKEVFTLPEGQETTRDEQAPDATGRRARRGATGTAPGAEGGILNSPIAVGVGAAGIIGVTTWVLMQNDEPLSNSKPN
jgi:hypothetical protein